MDTQARDMAKWLAARGFSVFPIPARSKAPAPGSRWKARQTLRLDPEAVASVVTPGSNYGIATGALSDVVVVDVDAKGATSQQVKAVVDTIQRSVSEADGTHAPVVVTGSGGAHLYFRFTPFANSAGLPARAVPALAVALPADCPILIDVRGEGGFVVGPGSVHPNGNMYRVSNLYPLVDPETMDVPKPYVPHWLSEAILGAKPRSASDRLPFTGIAQGERNMTMASVAGTLLRRLPPSEWDLARKACLGINRMFGRPPLTDAEASAVVESIAKAEHARREEAKARR